MERRNFSHSQRMGGINSIVLSKDEKFVLSVGQERRLTYWDMNKQEPARLFFLDGEADEGKVLAISQSGRLIATGNKLSILRITSRQRSYLYNCPWTHLGPTLTTLTPRLRNLTIHKYYNTILNIST